MEDHLKSRILRKKFKKTSIYEGPFESIRFYFREYKVMTPFSKNTITFWREQVISYMTSVTYDSVKKITVPIRNYIRYQNDLTSVAKPIGSPKNGVNPIEIFALIGRGPHF